MFKCKDCQGQEFKLVIQPEYDGLVSVSTNAHLEVEVAVKDQSFVADLMFMNQFAVCGTCGSTKRWEYFFPNRLIGSAT